jgi:peptide deformylase
MWIRSLLTESTGNKIEARMGKQKTPSMRSLPREASLERLRTFGDPVLRQETKPVTVFDHRLEKLAQVMLEVMDREEGVGLAAPQIGVLRRVMVWRHPEEDAERYVFVNPKIVERSEACGTQTERCLSVPEATMEVTRAEEVVVEAQDLRGEPLEVRLAGFLARIVQHEIDHLDGCLILDRTSPEERRRVLKELRERTLAAGT